jgi:ribonucleoside-diphosphate reductase alpha subunit
MRVTKRDGQLQEVAFDKILERVKKLGQEAGIHINYSSLVMKVIDQLYDTIPTSKIDELAAEQCASLSTNHLDYGILASRIIISNHKKNTDPIFSNVMASLYNFTNINGEHRPLVSQQLWEFTEQYHSQINEMIVHERDYLIDYFGFKTLEKGYLFSINHKIVETPQHLWMRVAIGIHGDTNNLECLALIKETYDLMSLKFFTHATPTLFNAGTPRQQLSSCYLISMEEDSIEGIFNTLKDCAQISKYSGGIGLHIHNVRAKGSHIQGTNGITQGIAPMLNVFNSTAKYVNQCFTPDAWVYSKNGPVQFKDVTSLDELVTIDGTFKKVNEVIITNINKEIFEVKIVNSIFPIKVTKEHELYLIKNQRRIFNLSTIKTRLEQNLVKPNFYSASEISLSDLVGFPIPTYEKDNDIEDLDFYKFYGIMLGNGDISTDFFKIYNKLDLNKNQIHPSFLNLPKHKILKILEGLFNADVSIPSLTNLYFITSSLLLIMQVRYLLLRIGILTPGDIYEKVNKKISYALKIPKHKSYFEWNGFLWGRIQSVNKINYVGEVYDFNMADNHNYLTDMGLVHNSGKRNGSIAIYLEPWHPDVEDFLELKKNHGDEETKSRTLFYALWISDLFMERVKNNLKWSLFCPNECPGLSDVYSDKFNTLYESYESAGKARKIVNARDLWFKILDAQMETGTPYILYKDAANKKSNQQNLGTIKSSNLCCEIIEYSDDKETAVCNLASIGLPSFVNEQTKQFDYEKLHQVTKVITNNLNRVIDINFYPTDKTKLSNLRHRPIGIGIQGLADTFIMLDIAFHSEEAKIINTHIFETIYHAALEKSNEMAMETTPYSSFNGSPASKGILQFDMWNIAPSNRYDWNKLKQSIVENGLRNSLLIAPMPTATTSQILGFNECFEPLTSNLYSRRTLAGEFVVVNKYLMKELIDQGLWNEQIKNNIIANKGSVQQLTCLSEKTKNKYKIVWEMPMKHLIDMSVDRGAFICQSQSLNLWLEDPTYNSLTSMHFYSWKAGLKTGIYYLRRKAKHQAQQFTIEPVSKKTEEREEICEMCSA